MLTGQADIPTTDTLYAALTLSLHLSASPLSERRLTLLTGETADAVRRALLHLEEQGLAARRDDGAWLCLDVSDALLRELSATLRVKVPTERLIHCLGYLLADATLDDCEYALRRLDPELKRPTPESLFCLECVIGYLLRWEESHRAEAAQHSSHYAELVLVAQSICLFLPRQLQMAARLSASAHAVTSACGNERFRLLVTIFSFYLRLFSDEKPPREAARAIEELGDLEDFDDKDMQGRLPLFKGLLHYVRGEFGQVLRCYEQKEDTYGWKYRRFAVLLASCASQSAFYLQQYHIALGINESCRRTAALDGDSMLSMFWMLHLAFVMLRLGDMDAALLNLDCLFMAVPARENNKTSVSTVRGIALYHYLHGRLRQAHALLAYHAGRALRRNLPHAPFEDPLNLDMLYAFEQEGFPPSRAIISKRRWKGSLRAPTASCGARPCAWPPCGCAIRASGNAKPPSCAKAAPCWPEPATAGKWRSPRTSWPPRWNARDSVPKPGSCARRWPPTRAARSTPPCPIRRPCTCSPATSGIGSPPGPTQPMPGPASWSGATGPSTP